jgi:capsid protein
VHLTEAALSKLREICRDHGRGNPIVKGLLATEAKGVVGSETKVEARTPDKGWNDAAEALWKAEMVDQPCDVTGPFNFHKLLNLAYKSYRRDGDDLLVFEDEALWLVEGEQCGTPYGMRGGESFEVTNGVATRRSDGRVIGYYIGKPDRWGFVQASSFSRYTTDQVHHIFNPDRVSYTRGEPVLVAADRTRSTARRRRWYSKMASHRGKKTAIVAPARKLPATGYRLLRDDTVYHSSLMCRPAA